MRFKALNYYVDSTLQESKLQNDCIPAVKNIKMMDMSKLLWRPAADRVSSSNMLRFIGFVNKKYGMKIVNYDGLYNWSVENIADFWGSIWTFVDVVASRPYQRIIDDVDKMPGAEWFAGARLNFAQNLLRYRDDRTALIFKGEDHECVKMTYAELYGEVAKVAAALKAAGVTRGDRVAGFMPNMCETVVAMLAAASLGAIWSSCSPDFGIKGVVERFGQICPKILFGADGYFYKGKGIDSTRIMAKIAREIPSIEKIVVVPYAGRESDIGGIPNAVRYHDFRPDESDLQIDFCQLPFNHPLYIMYSSGTTGLPKCLVHSAGGILINQLKELILHTDLKRHDNIFYFTTCGWMMWNWLVCSLGVGAAVVIYDGSPFYPDPGILWRLADDEKVTIFGTSAGYINALQGTDVKPMNDYDLASVKTILSTGSPLSVEGFEYVYRTIKEDVQLSSISGGTDINGCFFLGNPMSPVYAGELQCRGLGMKVAAFDESGKPVFNTQGELVCTAPSPSMPICFWNDTDNKKYIAAYFDVYPGIWRHGDYIAINDNGGVIIYGRSDATLNPGGVRIGTAEIYRQVEMFDEIEDSIVVGQTWKNDTRVILFVVMKEGNALSGDLKGRVRSSIRTNISPRHVPAKIVATPAIPYTLNMKKVEIAVRKVIHGEPVLNRDALRDPKALDYYAGLKELQEE